VVSQSASPSWAIVGGIVSLAVLAGLVYVAYKTGAWLFGGDDNAPSIDSLERSRSSSTSASAGDTSESRQDRLRRQYVEGQISEAEFERRIARASWRPRSSTTSIGNSNGNNREPSGPVGLKTVPKLLAQVVEVEVLHREQHQQVVDEVCALVGEFVEVVVFRREDRLR